MDTSGVVSTSLSKTLEASCYCKAVQYSIEISITKLPLPVDLCHCNICRYTHGMLCAFRAQLPDGVAPEFTAPSSMSNLTGYKHANTQNERFFCSTCGCHVGNRAPEGSEGGGQWVVASSLFSYHGEDAFRIRRHCFTESLNREKGVFDWLPKIDDRDMKMVNSEPDGDGWCGGIEEQLPKKEFDKEGNEVLRAACHCGGVSFTIPRPTIPAIKDDSYLSTWTSPIEPNKWMACLDACDDCRLHNGTHFAAWTFVPRALVQPPMPQDLAPYGTMKTYSSSRGVLRGFCGECGATVIYSSDERMPSPEKHVIDVAVGVLRAPGGVLAEDWVTWRTSRVGWSDSGEKFDLAFTGSLVEGMRKWSLNTYGEIREFLID